VLYFHWVWKCSAHENEKFFLKGLDIFKGGSEGQLILKYTLNDVVSFSDVKLFAEPSIVKALLCICVFSSILFINSKNKV